MDLAICLPKAEEAIGGKVHGTMSTSSGLENLHGGVEFETLESRRTKGVYVRTLKKRQRARK